MTGTPSLTVFERVAAIIAELPPIDKTQENKQQGFMFRGHDDVLNALNPLLAKHGVMCVPDVIDRTTSERHTATGKIMFEVSLHVRFTFYGAGGDSFSGSTWGEGTDMGDKATSKAMTMAFKSMLNQTFAISNKEAADPDGDPAEESEHTQQPHPRGSGTSGSVITEPQVKRLFAIARSKNVDNEKVREIVQRVAGVASSAEIPRGQYDAVVEAVEQEAIAL